MTIHSEIRGHQRSLLERIKHIAILLLISTGLTCVALGDDLPTIKPADPVGLEEANALFKIIRTRATSSDEIPIPEPIAAQLNKTHDLPVIVTLFQDGLSRFHHTSTQPTLRGCAEDTADQLKLFFARSPVGKKMADEGRITLDIVTGGKNLSATNRALLSQQLAPGVDGLVCIGERRTDYFTPLTVLKHARDLDAVEKMYASQASAMPPERFAAARMRTLCFVEDRPHGSALHVYRGNVPVHSPEAYDMAQAMSQAGVWLLRSQRPDGSFPPLYHPADETLAEIDQDLTDHMRTTSALQALYTLLGDEKIRDARDRALSFAVRALRKHQTQNIAFLPDKHDPISGSALLLSMLCRKAIAEPKPTVTGPMRYLAEFLCVMTDERGRLYTSVSNALAKSPPYVVKGEPYAETLIALTLYQRVMSGGKASLASRRLADRLTALPAALPRTLLDMRTWPRTIDALTRYHEISGNPQCVKAILDLTAKLAKRQIYPEKGRYTDYEGGFAEPDLPPSTEFSSAAICAMANAYGIMQRTKQPTDEIATSVRRAAEFLMNMQYRDKNTFFLRHPSLFLGAFRRTPEDLAIHPVAVAQATRALMLATTITAQTAPPNPMP